MAERVSLVVQDPKETTSRSFPKAPYATLRTLAAPRTTRLGSARGSPSTPCPRAAFTHRGYYLTLTRTPTFGLDAWKKTIDAVLADGGNLVILWTAGGFKSKKFPATWAHNRDHENVKKDFVRELIDYAHGKGVKVLLGFTPFGYDGVNRMSLDRPEWAATGPDGKPAKPFGIHSWGRNLCPARGRPAVHARVRHARCTSTSTRTRTACSSSRRTTPPATARTAGPSSSRTSSRS